MNLLLLCSFMLVKSLQVPDSTLVKIRALYAQAANTKSNSDKLSLLLSKVDTLSDPVLVCYKGAAEMIKAKFLFSPFSKMGTFNGGKTLIELAVKRAPDDLEIRFVRFGIQVNLPQFLKYSGNIEEDKKLLIDNIKSITDPELKKNIINYLSDPKFCTEEEIKKLKET